MLSGLGFRSHFSIGESMLEPDDIIAEAQKHGMTTIAVCDTMTVSSIPDVAKAAEKAGIRVLHGVRVRVVQGCETEESRKKDAKLPEFFLKVFPKNKAGLVQIFELLTFANSEARFYMVPRVNVADIIRWCARGDVLITTGDLQGLSTYADAHSVARDLCAFFEPENVWAEFCPINTPLFDRLNKETADLAIAHPGMGALVTMPAFYKAGDHASYEVYMATTGKAGFGGDITKPFTWKAPHNHDFHAHESVGVLLEQMVRRINERFDCGMAMPTHVAASFNAEFAAAISYAWKKEDISLPNLSADPDHDLMELCKKGLRARFSREVFGHKPTGQELRDVYVPRLHYEMDVLKRLNFSTYFLLVSDLVNWSKDNGIMVGPGRGSVGGSLVAYLIGITDVDPIRFGLLFERFINPERLDLPDADLDFMSTRRQEVVEYLTRKYGEDRVAGISNYGAFAGASALRAVAKSFGHNMQSFDVSKFVPKLHGQPVDLEDAVDMQAEIRKFADKYPREWKEACAVQGKMNIMGRHAAGVVVAGVPLSKRSVVERRSGEATINWDKDIAESMGLVKLDVLGLAALDTIDRALKYIWKRHTKRIDLMSVPLDDASTLRNFSNGKCMGVFQFEGGAARRLLKDMASSSDVTFDDLVAANALNRPGPIEAGLVQKYVESRSSRTPQTLPHPNMAAALAETWNIICYQEQVMRVSMDLCGFTAVQADHLRKAMGKKDAAKMAKMRDDFVQGAVKTSGMAEGVAGELFTDIEGFSAYAFNKSHAVEYSLISYLMMWLKTHYPVEFFAAALSTVKEDKLMAIVEDAGRLGIRVLPPDINESTGEFEILNDTTLLIPINRVKGCQGKTVDAIVTVRAGGKFFSKEDFETRIQAAGLKRHCHAGQIEKLDTVGAFARIEPSQPPADHPDRIREQLVLIPGLVVAKPPITRQIPLDNFTLARVGEIVRDYRAAKTSRAPQPYIGNRAKFMIVQDCALRGDESELKFGKDRNFSYVAQALNHSGLNREDAYITGISKVCKEGKSIPNADLNLYTPFFERELDVLKPPIIVLLGAQAIKHFFPDLKGGAMEFAGRVEYDAKRDAVIFIGFNPSMIYFDPDKQNTLDEIFSGVADLLA